MRQVLKYPGSKWNIARQLVELIPPHHSYVEAFFGSGAMFFSKSPSDIETINDLILTSQTYSGVSRKIPSVWPDW